MNYLNENSNSPRKNENSATLPSLLETEQPMLRSINEFDSPVNKLAPPKDAFQISQNSTSNLKEQAKNDEKALTKRFRRSKTTNELTSLENSEGSNIKASTMLSRRARPGLTLKKSEERGRSQSVGREEDVPKEPASAGVKSTREDNAASFFGEIVISQRKGVDDLKKSGKRGILNSKPVTISLTFDAFMDRVKGVDHTTVFSNYPSHKIDKRLIFLGKELDYPWHIISYHSTFRKLWNIFIVMIILYEIFWYPLAATFIRTEAWPLGIFIFELISIGIFLIDILVNIRSTFSNENNEEIIDTGMIRRNYLKKPLFIIDVATVLPIPEIVLLILVKSSVQWQVYSLVILIRLLRIFKISEYLQNRVFSIFAKLLKIFIMFFLGVHLVTCVWYVIVKAEYFEPPSSSELWFPNTLRMIQVNEDADLFPYYTDMPLVHVYELTLLSVMMLTVGSDMAPAGDAQIWVTIIIGLFGAATLAYIFGMVILAIERATVETQLYQKQNEELKQKLRINNIPHNLKIKVMEYFYYSWRKHRVLKKTDDFSELSLPLQRDLALYQHQEMILKVPLFKELDPVEILSIVQKLKTSIYMPGDKIIREGERGTEMFFVQEGVAEMLIKKTENDKQQMNMRPKYERILLEKGNYFGEVALMSNSKRTFDVNAYEFCILYALSRNDYNSLKVEFKDIGPRLRSGLKHYKNTQMASLIQILKNLDIFQGFTDKELQRIGDEYLEEVFVDPDKVILAPKSRINSIYVVVAGKINCYADNEETREYLSHLKRSNDRDNFTVVDIDEEEDVGCLDDDVLKMEKDKLSMEDDKNKLDLDKVYTYGEYFGTLDFDVNEIRCNQYFVTDSGCRIGAITQSLKSQMAEDDPVLYEKLKYNMERCCPRRGTIPPIDEESDSSFTTRNNTIVRTKLSKRFPSLTDIGRKPYMIKIASLNQNKDDDPATVKDDLLFLEGEMNRFRALVSNINGRLARIATTYYKGGPTKSGETSPERRRSLVKPASKVMEQIKALEKPAPSKELAQALLGLGTTPDNE